MVSPGLTRESLTQLRDTLKNEKGLVIIFGSELRDGDVKTLVDFGLAQGAKFICLGDYANSRGAADMGLYPECYPATLRWAAPPSSTKSGWTRFLKTPGHEPAANDGRSERGKLKALYVVGSNPVARYNIDPFVLLEELRHRPGHVPDRDGRHR